MFVLSKRYESTESNTSMLFTEFMRRPKGRYRDFTQQYNRRPQKKDCIVKAQSYLNNTTITDGFRTVSWSEKGRDMTQLYDKSPYTLRQIQNATWQQKKRHQKLRLNNDFGPT